MFNLSTNLIPCEKERAEDEMDEFLLGDKTSFKNSDNNSNPRKVKQPSFDLVSNKSDLKDKTITDDFLPSRARFSSSNYEINKINSNIKVNKSQE